MDFKEYQQKAQQFALYAERGYPFLALPEEVGEFLGLKAKEARGDNLNARFGGPNKVREALLKEAGDVLWQLTACLSELGMTLEEAAQLNIEKLSDRKARGVIKGSGDNR